MICYQDMTFCNAECAALDCSRKLTQQVREDAEKWMENAPIAIADFSEDCEEYLPYGEQRYRS